MSLLIKEVSFDQQMAFVSPRPTSYMQFPSWSEVKLGWTPERLGWFDRHGQLVGVALVTHKALPLSGRSIAYVADGPVVDWGSRPAAEWLEPLVAHAKRRGSISIRVGPHHPWRLWGAATVKGGASSGGSHLLADLPPDHVDKVGDDLVRQLKELGWVQAVPDSGYPGVTRFVFQVPLRGRTTQSLWAGLNQQWRRGIRKASAAGVSVARGTYEDLPDFHRVFVETAQRNGFFAHPIAYFERIYEALSSEGSGRVALYLASHDGEVLAGMLVTSGGPLAIYAYGGSSAHKRELFPSYAAHWQILQDCLAEQKDVYDMRAIHDTLDPGDPNFGVTRFKLGTGGNVVEQVGEWDFAIVPAWHHALHQYFRIRRRLLSSRWKPAAGRAEQGPST